MVTSLKRLFSASWTELNIMSLSQLAKFSISPTFLPFSSKTEISRVSTLIESSGRPVFEFELIERSSTHLLTIISVNFRPTSGSASTFILRSVIVILASLGDSSTVSIKSFCGAGMFKMIIFCIAALRYHGILFVKSMYVLRLFLEMMFSWKKRNTERQELKS